MLKLDCTLYVVGKTHGINNNDCTLYVVGKMHGINSNNVFGKSLAHLKRYDLNYKIEL